MAPGFQENRQVRRGGCEREIQGYDDIGHQDVPDRFFDLLKQLDESAERDPA